MTWTDEDERRRNYRRCAMPNNWTPGPWRIGPINYADVYGSDGEIVALIPKEDPNTVANALFIAAAPDLYEALELMTREIVERHDITIGTMVKAHAALAKARGEA